MPMKRYKRKGRSGLKRRYVKKRNYRTSKPKPARVHLFKRLAVTTRITNSGTAGIPIQTGNVTIGPASGPNNFGYDFGASMVFRLQDTENYTELTALYDRYKITGAKVKIIPLSNTANTGGLGYLPELMYAFDIDDAAVPTETYMRQKGAKCKRLDKPISIYIKPRIANVVWQSQIASGYTIAPVGYVNCSSPGVEHYGLKMFFRNVDLRVNTSVSTQFNFETTFYLAMKDPQ